MPRLLDKEDIKKLEEQINDDTIKASQISDELVVAYKGIYNRFFKRILDFVLSCILFLITLPIMLIISIIIVLDSGFPVFYRAERGGYHQKNFRIFKFRTMVQNADQIGGGTTALDDSRITRVGAFLRKTKLDEFANLISIMSGKMSFIGPRPWIPDYYEWFTIEQKRRVDVLPGISGLAQVRGRNGIDIFTKINYDLQYVDNISFKLDLKLVFETIKTVFSKDDAEISEQGIKEEISELKKQSVTYKEVV